MLFTNQFFCGILKLLPHPVAVVILWAAVILFLLDFITSAMAVQGMKISIKRLSNLSDEMQHTSKFLENRLTAVIQKRMIKSFPAITRENLENSIRERNKLKESTVFAEGCSFYKLVSLFFIGAFLGDITETIFCLITTGTLMSRSSVVYGPFSIVWGLAIAAATLLLYKYKDSSDGFIFLVGTLLGGAYEYVCSVFTEIVFGTVFWDYSQIPFNLGGRINLLYCFFWGIAAVVWIKKLYPVFSGLIEKIPVKTGKIMTWILIAFMSCNIIVSCMALVRYNQRSNGIPADSGWQKVMDERFDDERLERIYPNAIAK